MNDIENIVNRFFEKRIKVSNHRYESWEHCYSQFQTQLKKGDLSSQEEDFLTLHLAFYLASWGMYRGSSFLLQRDYKVLVPIVKLLFNKGKEFTDEKLMQLLKSDSSVELEEYVRRYFAFDTLLINELEPIRNSVRDGKGETQNEVSYTLRTKILLGTLGCVPAYDRFFRDGIRLQENEDLIMSYSPNGLAKLIAFVKIHQEELVAAQSSFDTPNYSGQYPIMKILDMLFFQIGLEEYNEKKAKKTKELKGNK